LENIMGSPKLDAARKAEIVACLRKAEGGVISTVAKNNRPESAFIYIAVTPELEIIFETLITSRKYVNIGDNPYAAFVADAGDARTIQMEGVVDEPVEIDLESLKRLYYEFCPQNLSHRHWPGLTYLRLRPRWIRFSDYGHPWQVEEFVLGQ
jgi:pyridoxine/pyridoxamine 5'-phosphate oxidase